MLVVGRLCFVILDVLLDFSTDYILAQDDEECFWRAQGSIVVLVMAVFALLR